MNIIIVGGYDTNFSVGFVKGLKMNGLEMCVVSGDETAGPLSAAGIRNLNLRGSSDRKRSVLQKLFNLTSYYIQTLMLLMRHRGATVHFAAIFRNEFILWEGLILNLCFRVFAGHYIYTVHNVLPHGRAQSRFFRWVYTRIYRIPDTLLVHTGLARQQLIDEFGVPQERIQLTSIGLNEEMPMTDLSRDQARKHLGFSDDEQLLLFFGKIEEYKGLDLLLDAFDLLPFPKARLIIAGEYRSSEYRTRIKGQLARVSRLKDVQLHERYIPNSEAEVFFKAADVLCLPYRHIYQSGLAFLAPRFGIPMITTDVGALRDYVGDDLGIVTSGNDAVGIARALEQFLSDRDRFSRERILARAARYRWDLVCQKLVPLYSPDFSEARPIEASPQRDEELVHRPFAPQTFGEHLD